MGITKVLSPVIFKIVGMGAFLLFLSTAFLKKTKLFLSSLKFINGCLLIIVKYPFC